MTDALTPTPVQPKRLEQRGLFMRLVYGALGQTGARIGLVWVGFLIAMAVLAPVLANSHPFYWRGQIDPTDTQQRNQVGVIFSEQPIDTDTGLQTVTASPMLGYLNWVDYTLLLSLVIAMALWPMRKLGGKRVLIWAGATVAITVISVFTVDVPENDLLSFYREQADAGLVEVSIEAPLAFSPNDRQRDALARTNKDPRLQQPSGTHWLGTTAAGADVLSRMIHASRIALTIGLIATGIAVTIGIIVGGIMGYFAGKVDLLGMRLVEVFSAIPVIFLLIMIVAFYGRSLYLMTVILGLTGWVGYALYVRAEFLKIRSMDYVQAARAAGLPLQSILFKHMLPNGITPVLVLASFGIASMILTESTLSFIGLGLVEDPSWGQMLNEARSAGTQWGLVIFPGLAIFLTVLSYNLIGEALRDAIDPHANRD